MIGPHDKVRVISGHPHSFGWLRRSELERQYPGYFVWEAPNGGLYIHKKDGPPLIIEKLVEDKNVK